MNASSHNLISTLVRLIKQNIRLILNQVLLLRFLEEVLFPLVFNCYLRIYLIIAAFRCLRLQSRRSRSIVLQLYYLARNSCCLHYFSILIVVIWLITHHLHEFLIHLWVLLLLLLVCFQESLDWTLLYLLLSFLGTQGVNKGLLKRVIRDLLLANWIEFISVRSKYPSFLQQGTLLEGVSNWLPLRWPLYCLFRRGDHLFICPLNLSREWPTPLSDNIRLHK